MLLFAKLLKMYKRAFEHR